MAGSTLRRSGTRRSKTGGALSRDAVARTHTSKRDSSLRLPAAGKLGMTAIEGSLRRLVSGAHYCVRVASIFRAWRRLRLPDEFFPGARFLGLPAQNKICRRPDFSASRFSLTASESPRYQFSSLCSARNALAGHFAKDNFRRCESPPSASCRQQQSSAALQWLNGCSSSLAVQNSPSDGRSSTTMSTFPSLNRSPAATPRDTRGMRKSGPASSLASQNVPSFWFSCSTFGSL